MQDLIKKLQLDFPEFSFKNGKRFLFRYPRTIMIGSSEPGSEISLLHELGHAILGHKSYKTDVERLKMETEAWEKARELAKKYQIDFNEEMIQNDLDTYRDWLHKKSRCPKCGLTRFQDKDKKYHCPRCENLC